MDFVYVLPIATCSSQILFITKALLMTAHNICLLLEIRKNVNFPAGKSWLDKWILNFYLSMDV